MATQPTPPPSGADQQGGAPQGAPAPGGQPGGGLEPHRMLAAMTRLAQMCAQATPAVSADMEKVTSAVTDAMRKLVAGQPPQPGAQQAPPY